MDGKLILKCAWLHKFSIRSCVSTWNGIRGPEKRKGLRFAFAVRRKNYSKLSETMGFHRTEFPVHRFAFSPSFAPIHCPTQFVKSIHFLFSPLSETISSAPCAFIEATAKEESAREAAGRGERRAERKSLLRSIEIKFSIANSKDRSFLSVAVVPSLFISLIVFLTHLTYFKGDRLQGRRVLRKPPRLLSRRFSQLRKHFIAVRRRQLFSANRFVCPVLSVLRILAILPFYSAMPAA